MPLLQPHRCNCKMRDQEVHRDNAFPVRNREGGDLSVPHQEHVCLLCQGKDESIPTCMQYYLYFIFQDRCKQKCEKYPTPPDRDCVICYEQVSQELRDFERIRVPCCGRYFHRDCLQSYALTSGENHFKCANCNDKGAITRELHRMGIYIPIQDAEWESADHSHFYGYEEMYEKNRKKRCDVKVCQLGRDQIGGEGSQTEVILCVLCGTNGCHVKCAGLSDEDEFRCANYCTEGRMDVQNLRLKSK